MNAMRNILMVLCAVMMSCTAVFAQKKTIDGKRIKEVKEWKSDGKSKYVCEIDRYDENGKKSEQIKYEAPGKQKSRVTYEYNSAGKCVKETEYDENNKLSKYIVIEYNADGKKIKEIHYAPNGKVKNSREIEYITY